MSHHGNDEDAFRRMNSALDAMFKESYGEFPNGRLSKDDQGAIPVGIGHQDGKVVMSFPRNLNWIGFTADQAIDIANSLIEHARAVGSKKPLTVKIG